MVMTETTPNRPLAALIASRVAPDSSDVETTLKTFIKAKEEEKALEKRLETLKAQIEQIRQDLGGEKRTVVNGKFNNKKGQFIITHISSTRRTISVERAQEILSPELFNMLVNVSESEFNKVTFSVGQG